MLNDCEDEKLIKQKLNKVILGSRFIFQEIKMFGPAKYAIIFRKVNNLKHVNEGKLSFN